ncbi:hypothetical protein JCM16138_11350 [Thermococcus atlanticus]
MKRGILSLESGAQIAARFGAELLDKLLERNPGRGRQACHDYWGTRGWEDFTNGQTGLKV